MGQDWLALHLAPSYHGSDWLALHLAPSYHGSDCLARHCQQLTWTLKEPSKTCRLHMISTVNTGMLYHERLRLLYRF
ncbi:hypothetical protein DPMN_178715 [Dreissena polymorpha]|uniref:Uncharacterized protein n=1 Tax=Dreissena polymorpha TaxID=45954 RepID=A0A9D4IK55_DREPO|nr:hypothetical protein DPMN_178715 [Dreissena polymorpha]